MRSPFSRFAKRYLPLLCLALCAGIGRAHAAPSFVIGYVEYTTSPSIGGQKVRLKNLKLTDMKILGAWIFEDKAGRHAYVFVDPAQEAKWSDSDLVVTLGGQLFEVNQMRRWKTGESALILDDVDDDSAALLRQSNLRAPLDEQLEFGWQKLDDGKVRVNVTNNGSQTLRLALHNAQYLVEATRDGKPIRVSIAPDGIDEAPTFETLKPKATWQRELTLAPNIESSQVGHYQVEIETQFPMQTGGKDDAPEYVVLKFPAQFEFDIAPKLKVERNPGER